MILSLYHNDNLRLCKNGIKIDFLFFIGAIAVVVTHTVCMAQKMKVIVTDHVQEMPLKFVVEFGIIQFILYN
jgi:hypothetical protein